MSKDNLVDDTGLRSVDAKHAPVSLPPGSFDMEKLVPALDKAHDHDDRDTEIGKAIETGAAEGTVIGQADPRSQDGFTMVDVERTDLGVTERFQVFDGKAASDDAGGVVLLDPKARPPRKTRAKPPRKSAAPKGADKPTDPAPTGDAGQSQE